MVDTGRGTLLLLAGPRPRGTSAMLLNRLQRSAGGSTLWLYNREQRSKAVEAMREAERIVVCGPSYVNAYPAVVTEVLEEALEGGFRWEGKQLYGIINGGMPYAHTHRQGLKTLELFAQRSGMHWMGGFVLGVGAMLDGQPLEKHMSARKVVPAFRAFCRLVAEGKEAPDALWMKAQTRMPRLLAPLAARFMNRMVDKRLRAFGHDPQAVDDEGSAAASTRPMG